jgi:hypothetical protein
VARTCWVGAARLGRWRASAAAASETMEDYIRLAPGHGLDPSGPRPPRQVARGRCAAGGEAADHRIPGPPHTVRHEPLDRCPCAAAARTRLDRGAYRRVVYRWADGRSDRMTEIVAEFVRLKVDIIVTGGTADGIAAKQTTSAIPIIFAQSEEHSQVMHEEKR